MASILNKVKNWVSGLTQRTNVQQTDRILVGIPETGKSMWISIQQMIEMASSGTIWTVYDEWDEGKVYSPGSIVPDVSVLYPGTVSLYVLKGNESYLSEITPSEDPDHWFEYPAIQGPAGKDFKYTDFTPSQLAALKGDPFTWADMTPEQKEELKGDKGDQGIRGFGVFLTTNQLTGSTGNVPLSSIILPPGIILTVGDFLFSGHANSQGYFARITAVAGSTITYEYILSLKGPKGDKGDDAGEPEMRKNLTHIQFKTTKDTNWADIIAIAELIGPKGDKGDPGKDLKFDASGPLAGRDLFDSEEEGFTYVSTDESPSYIYQRLGAPGNWSDPIPFQGPPGKDGREVEFGTTEGTAAMGNDQRINNGQIAFERTSKLNGGASGTFMKKASASDYDYTFSPILPPDLGIGSALVGRVPFKPTSSNSFASGGLQMSDSPVASSGVMRTLTGTVKGSDAVANNDLVALGQLLTKLEEYAKLIDLANYVQKVAGKDLSDKNFTAALEAKLLGINMDSKADLVGGVIPAHQLPSFVDDVLEFTNLAAFPTTGETGKIYVALDTNFTYRWSGSDYSRINEGVALGETSSTAYRGDRGKEAYDLRHSHSNKTVLDGISGTDVDNWNNKATIGTGVAQVRSNADLDARYLRSQKYKGVNAVTANRNLAVTDKDCLLTITANRTLTIASGLASTDDDAGFPFGNRADIYVAIGAVLTITQGTGVTLRHEEGTGSTTRTGFRLLTIVRINTNEYLIS